MSHFLFYYVVFFLISYFILYLYLMFIPFSFLLHLHFLFLIFILCTSYFHFSSCYLFFLVHVYFHSYH